MKAETQEKIVENNAKITKLLKENEYLAKSEGLNIPNENYAVAPAEKIQIPSGYIRVNEAFSSKYHLGEIVKSDAVRKNIAYSLQLSDLHNYIMNRIHIWGSVETMFIKSAVINLVSVMEAIVSECAENICCNPSACTSIKTCPRHFNRNQRAQPYLALEKMKELGIVDYDDSKMSRIKEIIDYRNRVHIRLAKDNEFKSADFDIELYNEVMSLLADLAEKVYDNGVKLYNMC